jgi:hypothetical protein
VRASVWRLLLRLLQQSRLLQPESLAIGPRSKRAFHRAIVGGDYAPDAYDFANGKPLTLLDGSNLLHLLAKHGVEAPFHLAEARNVATDRSATAS